MRISRQRCFGERSRLELLESGNQKERMSLYFDIETSALSDSELAAIMPPFDPAEVKCGNLGPEKAAIKIAEAEAKHQRDFIENAALDPLTGRVLCIGLLQGGKFSILEDADEAQLLSEFWLRVVTPGRRMIGFNIFLFDLPFVLKRSWKHGLKPQGIRKGRYWSDDFVDLRELWQMGDRQAHGSLDSIAKHFGVGQKNGNGKDFAKLWATDRPKAVEYLRNEMNITAAIAERMGVT